MQHPSTFTLRHGGFNLVAHGPLSSQTNSSYLQDVNLLSTIKLISNELYTQPLRNQLAMVMLQENNQLTMDVTAATAVKFRN